MATEDISRSAFTPEQRYAGVRMQQGRVTTDDDWNEGARIGDEDERRLRLDLIGSAGSADDGCKIENPGLNANGEIDFDIAAGTLYLGGLRLQAFAVEKYTQQADWLLQPASARQAPGASRFDLVYLEAWQQPVEAVEDNELFEAALGGPDTSTRLRTMRRVWIASDIAGPDCAAAFKKLTQGWTAAHLGTVDESGERVVDATLTVTFDNTGSSNDLCSPNVAGGYLGAENQAIRVQLVDATRVTWGFDNGAPLYRVSVDADLETITLQTEPKDQAHWPLADQIVEILPWSAVLANGEKLADPLGHLSRVKASYDPDTHTLKLTTPLPIGFGTEWQTRPDAAALGTPYYFLRVWYRGDDTTSLPAIPFTAGTAVPLGHTGLLVTLQGSDFVAGDHWIIAARPETPHRVVPWALEVARAPHGIRRFFTPLAVIRWQQNGVVTGTVVEDCRPLFEPLTRRQSCCTHTVGDGSTSHGHFTSIQKAIDSLPPQGGCVCILPGVYREDVLILGRRNVTLEGCGPRTRLLGATGNNGLAVVTIAASRDITIRSLAVENSTRIDILLLGSRAAVLFAAAGVPTGPPGAPALTNAGREVSFLGFNRLLVELSRIRLLELTLRARDASAVFGLGGHHIELSASRIFATALAAELDFTRPAGRWPLVLLAADDVLIERNEITAVNTERFVRSALGGIQIGGGSERVEIRRNIVTGGNGCGVTLGSVIFVPAPALKTRGDFFLTTSAWTAFPPAFTFTIDERGCIQVEFNPPAPDDPEGGTLVPVSTGAVSDVRILDNDISKMGWSGVGVAWFFDLAKSDQLIATDRLTIEGNRIRKCLQLDLGDLPASFRSYAAYGAIALADGELIVIRDNVIEGNGSRHVDPICGVFALHAAGLAVENNRILDNAPRIAGDLPVKPGLRGGIVCSLASTPAVTIATARFGSLARQNGVPAARVHDNIVSVPEGRALLLVAHGPVSVSRNQLTTRGVGTVRLNPNRDVGAGAPAGRGGGAAPAPDPLDQLGGAAVAILDLGVPNELRLQLLLYQMLKHVSVGAGPLAHGGRVAAGGNVLFNDNQVMLDLLERRADLVMSAVAVLSLDDVEIEGNQLDCDLDADLLVTDLLAFGFSIRLSDNRLKESLFRAVLSAAVMGLMTTVSFNQSTHCLLVVGHPNLTQNAGNRALVQINNVRACRSADVVRATLAAKYVGG